jgi:hypothetical protein
VADNRARTYGQLGQVCVDSSGSSVQPRRISLPDNVVDIMDLPPKRTGTSSGAPSGKPSSGSGLRPAGASMSVHNDSSVHQASATTDAENPYRSRRPRANKPIGYITQSQSDPSEQTSTTSRYGRADDHGWLKGRLEYSQAQRRWKLRYIPIDGQTDQFGGSVILRKTSLLSGFERGDYVEVNGRLTEKAASGDYAPEYELTQIRRVER